MVVVVVPSHMLPSTTNRYNNDKPGNNCVGIIKFYFLHTPNRIRCLRLREIGRYMDSDTGFRTKSLIIRIVAAKRGAVAHPEMRVRNWNINATLAINLISYNIIKYRQNNVVILLKERGQNLRVSLYQTVFAQCEPLSKWSVGKRSPPHISYNLPSNPLLHVFWPSPPQTIKAYNK